MIIDILVLLIVLTILGILLFGKKFGASKTYSNVMFYATKEPEDLAEEIVKRVKSAD